jgi:hypothetical protein
MKISYDNYEQYFLDHAEGNLSPEMERELSDFLDANPDLKQLLADFDSSPIQTVDISSDKIKGRLKRHLHPTDNLKEVNVEEWMIRQIEGLLDEKEEKELAEFINLNPAYTYDQEKFRQAKFAPDLTITYNRKDFLKKRAPLLISGRLAWLIPAAAAAVLIFFGIRHLQQPGVNYGTPSQISGTPSQTSGASSGTPSDISGTPSQIAGTPSHAEPPVPERTVSFRLKPVKAIAIEIELSSQIPRIAQSACSLPLARFAEEKEKSLIGKVFSNMLAEAKNRIGRNTDLDEIKAPDFNLWSVAKAGINGYNSISDRDLEFYVHRDADGDVSSYALIEQDRLVLEKKLGKD